MKKHTSFINCSVTVGGVWRNTHTHIHKSIKSIMNESDRQYVLTVCSEGQEKGFLLGIAASQGFKGHSGNAPPAYTHM